MPTEDRRVSAYLPNGDYAGFVRLSHDDIGQTIGEVYDKDANKLGAVQVDPQDNTVDVSWVFDPEGDQIGYVELARQDGEQLSAEIYWTGEIDEEPVVIAHLEVDDIEHAGRAKVEVRKKAEWGEVLGTLEPQHVSGEELALLSGGAALLIFL